MPAAVRLGDICSGHGCYPSRQNDQGSPDVFVNNLPSHRQGDSWAQHCCPDEGCHDSVAANGSPNVFVNGKPKCRVGDSVACGSTMVTGSADVIVN